MASVKVLRTRDTQKRCTLLKLHQVTMLGFFHSLSFLPQACSQDQFFSCQGVKLKRPSAASGHYTWGTGFSHQPYLQALQSGK